MKVVFGSVIYPECLSFYDEYINSINGQLEKNFSLLIINDGIEDRVVDEIVRKKIKKPYAIINNNSGLNPNDLRVKLIYEAKKMSADLLVIGDSDDKFSSDRIGKAIEAYEIYKNDDFFYNELRSFDGNDVMPKLPEVTVSINDILDCNYLGLSNVALRMGKIDIDFIKSLYGADDYAFDWYLFSRLLEEGKKGRFIPSVTYYRIYEGNTVGDMKKSVELVKKELEVKIIHYKGLMPYGEKYKKMYALYNLGQYEENTEKERYFWWDFLKIRRENRNEI